MLQFHCESLFLVILLLLLILHWLLLHLCVLLCVLCSSFVGRSFLRVLLRLLRSRFPLGLLRSVLGGDGIRNVGDDIGAKVEGGVAVDRAFSARVRISTSFVLENEGNRDGQAVSGEFLDVALLRIRYAGLYERSEKEFERFRFEGKWCQFCNFELRG